MARLLGRDTVKTVPGGCASSQLAGSPALQPAAHLKALDSGCLAAEADVAAKVAEHRLQQDTGRAAGSSSGCTWGVGSPAGGSNGHRRARSLVALFGSEAKDTAGGGTGQQLAGSRGAMAQSKLALASVLLPAGCSKGPRLQHPGRSSTQVAAPTCMIWILGWLTTSTGSGWCTSHRSAVPRREASGGGYCEAGGKWSASAVPGG